MEQDAIRSIQMAAECLECKPEEVIVFGVDTDISPYDCGSYDPVQLM